MDSSSGKRVIVWCKLCSAAASLLPAQLQRYNPALRPCHPPFPSLQRQGPPAERGHLPAVLRRRAHDPRRAGALP